MTTTNGLYQLADALSEAGYWLVEAAQRGPDLRVNAHKKAAHEATELAENPSIEELADVFICLVGTAQYHGWLPGEVAEAISDKVKVNRLRNWVLQPDGTWQHS